MNARTIVTSHPDLACEVCERRLLRGEQHDVFIVAGSRRIVCELCAPRALGEGWQRESERGELELAPARPRRGRGLLERLRGAAKAPAPEAGAAQPEPFDFLGGRAGASTEAGGAEALTGESLEPAAEPVHEPSTHELALSTFNAGEYPRRIAGVARSLGEPRVTVRTAEHADSVIVIVVAWELSWYRYEVDLDELELLARATAQGTELAELAREDLLGNARALESGTLELTG